MSRDIENTRFHVRVRGVRICERLRASGGDFPVRVIRRLPWPSRKQPCFRTHCHLSAMPAARPRQPGLGHRCGRSPVSSAVPGPNGSLPGPMRNNSSRPTPRVPRTTPPGWCSATDGGRRDGQRSGSCRNARLKPAVNLASATFSAAVGDSEMTRRLGEGTGPEPGAAGLAHLIGAVDRLHAAATQTRPQPGGRSRLLPEAVAHLK
jgi:hypothetical protein